MSAPRWAIAVGAIAAVIALSAWVTQERPLTAQQVQSRIAELQAQQLVIRNDVIRAAMRCDEWAVPSKPEVGERCREAVHQQLKMADWQFQHLEKQIDEWRAYVPR